jgi:hypothetical protein
MRGCAASGNHWHLRVQEQDAISDKRTDATLGLKHHPRAANVTDDQPVCFGAGNRLREWGKESCSRPSPASTLYIAQLEAVGEENLAAGS